MSPGKQGLVKRKIKEIILIQPNVKLHRKKEPEKGELQAGSTPSQSSLRGGRALEHEFLLQHMGCLTRNEERGREGMLSFLSSQHSLKLLQPNCRALASIR